MEAGSANHTQLPPRLLTMVIIGRGGQRDEKKIRREK